MAYKIVIKRLAERDIAEATEWYYTRGKHLAKKFIKKVEEAILLLKKNPEHYQKRYNEVRIMFMEIFPFGLYYTLESNTVFIHAVLHTKRDPRTGIERI